jgi:hypothetical protein
VRVAEVSTAELSWLQEAAVAQGRRSIGSAQIGPRLSGDRTHFLLLRPRKAGRGQSAATVRCLVLFHLRDGTARVGEIEVEGAVFEGLAQVDDAVRADEIVKELGRARVHRIADREDEPSPN